MLHKYTKFAATAILTALLPATAVPSYAEEKHSVATSYAEEKHSAVPSYAEEKHSDWGVGAMGGVSHVFATFTTANQFFAGPTNYPQVDLQLAYSTKPENSGKFAEAYNYPTVGFGITWSGLSAIPYQENAYLHDMVAAYGFFERDFYKIPKFSVGYDLRFGLGFTTSTYDPERNPNNIIFGSNVMFCIGAGLYVKWRPVEQLEFALRGNVRHHSAGRLCFPNYGLNEAGAEASVRYYMSAPHTKQTTHTMKNEFERKFAYNIMVGAGIHHCNTEWEAYHNHPEKAEDKVNSVEGTPKFFATFSTTYRYALKFSSGIGIDAFWATQDFMNRLRECDLILHGEEAVSRCGGYNPFSLGISLVQNFHFGNFSITGAVGIYLFKHYGIEEQLGYSYQKIGLRYDFPSLGGTFVSMACKSHYFTRAEMLELGLGVKL